MLFWRVNVNNAAGGICTRMGPGSKVPTRNMLGKKTEKLHASPLFPHFLLRDAPCRATSSRGKPAESDRKYQPPVSIPLDFERAVEGRLAVKPDADQKGDEEPGKKAKAKRKK
jgi:hypothetical protein